MKTFGKTFKKAPRTAVLLLGMSLALGTLTGCGDGEEEGEQGQQQQEEQVSSADLGQFTADTLDGGSFTQEDIFAKDVTIINFWSTTCGPCIAEMPDLAAYEESLPDNIQLITVCLDGSRKKEKAEQILQEAGFEGITLVGGDGDFLNVVGGVRYTPTTIFVDSDGNIATIELEPVEHIMGNAMIGSPSDLAAGYTVAVNQVLKAGGKAEISVEGE